MKAATEYLAGMTAGHMALWSAGYFLGLMLASLVSIGGVVLITGLLVVTFFLARHHSIQLRGKRTPVMLKDEFLDKLDN